MCCGTLLALCGSLRPLTLCCGTLLTLSGSLGSASLRSLTLTDRTLLALTGSLRSLTLTGRMLLALTGSLRSLALAGGTLLTLAGRTLLTLGSAGSSAPLSLASHCLHYLLTALRLSAPASHRFVFHFAEILGVRHILNL